MKNKITAKERAEKAVEKTLESFLKLLCKVTGTKFPTDVSVCGKKGCGKDLLTVIMPVDGSKTDDSEEDNENVH